MTRLTPVELDHAERAINLSLAGVDARQEAPVRRVCLHPDRTLTRIGRSTRSECDYCEASAVAAHGGEPELMPVMYLRELGVYVQRR